MERDRCRIGALRSSVRGGKRVVEIERRRRESRNGDGRRSGVADLEVYRATMGGERGFEVKTGNSSARRATKENGETIFSGGTSAIVARWLHNATLLVASFVERYSSVPVAVKSVE